MPEEDAPRARPTTTAWGRAHLVPPAGRDPLRQRDPPGPSTRPLMELTPAAASRLRDARGRGPGDGRGRGHPEPSPGTVRVHLHRARMRLRATPVPALPRSGRMNCEQLYERLTELAEGTLPADVCAGGQSPPGGVCRLSAAARGSGRPGETSAESRRGRRRCRKSCAEEYCRCWRVRIRVDRPFSRLEAGRRSGPSLLFANPADRFSAATASRPASGTPSAGPRTPPC